MTIIDKDHLPVPVAEMGLHRKTALTPMVFVEGPFTVITREGEFHTPEGWHGFLAIDREGYPYAIALESYRSTYEPVGKFAGDAWLSHLATPYTEQETTNG